MLGSRSIIHDGWKATTNHISTGVLDEEDLAIGSRDFGEDRWELFRLADDFSESHDVAGQHPEVVGHLAGVWLEQAEANNVLPNRGRHAWSNAWAPSSLLPTIRGHPPCTS